MIKFKQSKILTIIMAMCMLAMGVLSHGKESAAATATISGTVPCSEGSVIWTLNDSGELVFSGNGTTRIALDGELIRDCGDGWCAYWEQQAVNAGMTPDEFRDKITSVRVKENSVIHLDTCGCMFERFSNCTSIDLTGFDTQSVLDMSVMFENCKSLKTIRFNDLNTESVKSMWGMFAECDSLTTLDLSMLETDNNWEIAAMFADCDLSFVSGMVSGQ